MDNVYTLTIVDPVYNDSGIVGVFEAESLAYMARMEAESRRTDEDLDRGVYFRITAYKMGKLYFRETGE